MSWHQFGDQPPPELVDGLLSVQYINKNVCNHVYNLIVLDAYLDTYLKKFDFPSRNQRVNLGKFADKCIFIWSRIADNSN